MVYIVQYAKKVKQNTKILTGTTSFCLIWLSKFKQSFLFVWRRQNQTKSNKILTEFWLLTTLFSWLNSMGLCPIKLMREARIACRYGCKTQFSWLNTFESTQSTQSACLLASLLALTGAFNEPYYDDFDRKLTKVWLNYTVVLLEPVMRIDLGYTMCRLRGQGYQRQTYIGPMSNITPHNDAQYPFIRAWGVTCVGT